MIARYKRAVQKSLATFLCLALLLPGFSWALDARLEPGASRPSARPGVTALGTLAWPVNASKAVSRESLQPAAPAAAGAVRPLAAPQAVERHPIFNILSALQEKGMTLPETAGSFADAVKLEAAAKVLPEGSARQKLMGMARSLASGQGAGRGFDNARGRGPKAFEVPVGELRWTADRVKLPRSTREMPLRDRQIVGQDRALEAVKFGLEMPGRDYNAYLSGPEGSGRFTAAKHILDKIARKLPTPPDRVSVTDLENPQKTVDLELPPGAAPRFEAGVRDFELAFERGLSKAILKGPVADYRRRLEDRGDRASEARWRAFDKAVAKVRIAGKFGIKILRTRTERGLSVEVVTTYSDGGLMRTFETEKERVELIKAGRFSEAQWDRAVAGSRRAAKPLLARLEALMREESAQFARVQDKIENAERTTAVILARDLGQALLAVAAPQDHNDEAHRLWREGADKRLAAFYAELAKVRVGAYGVDFKILRSSTGRRVIFGITRKAGGRMRRMTHEELKKAALAPGLIKALVQAAAPHSGTLNALFALEEEEHRALHAQDAVPTAAEAKADGYARNFLMLAALRYRDFLPPDQGGERNPFSRFRINVSVLASGKPGQGAPVIVEPSPSVKNLLGYAEKKKMTAILPGEGPLTADDPAGPVIHPGALVKAHGGFLVLNVIDVLREPGAWPALMRAIRTGEAEIVEDGLAALTGEGEKHSLSAKVKVILIGSPVLKMLLADADEDFKNFFKAPVEFESRIPINAKSVAGYLRFFKQSVEKAKRDGGKIIDLERGAMGALLEYAAELADSHKLFSAQFGALHSLMKEATLFARKRGASMVRRGDVETALAARREREGQYLRHYQQLLKDRIFVVETSGQKVGQMNALAILGDYGGLPHRMTATVAVPSSPEKSDILSADREAQMTGTSYNKAIEVLKGLFGSILGGKKSLTALIRMSAEQEYDGIDGDSATSTKAYAILSALSGVPILQRYANTGSADQFGAVQAIGGVNHKIAGFYDLAKARGLTGDQGVVIPATNVGDLMLRPDIVEAARRKRFHIYAVKHIKEGIEILTGVPYPVILKKAQARLDEIRAAVREAGGGGKH